MKAARENHIQGILIELQSFQQRPCRPTDSGNIFKALRQAKSVTQKWRQGQDQTKAWGNLITIIDLLPRWLTDKKSACQCSRPETWVWSLGQEHPLEEEMATHMSVLTWEIPCTEEPGRLQFMGSQSRTQLSIWEHRPALQEMLKKVLQTETN